MSENPKPCAVYRAFDATGKLIYVGIANNWARRWRQHSERSTFFPEVARVEVQQFPTRQHARAEEMRLIAEHNPQHNDRGRSDEPSRKQKTNPSSRQHRWVRLSGTTEECVDCECTAYHQTEDGRPQFDGGVIEYARWIDSGWVGWTIKDTREPPLCVPSRSSGRLKDVAKRLWGGE